MITRSRVARISTEPRGISQPSRSSLTRAGIVCSHGAQNDAIVRKPEARCRTPQVIPLAVVRLGLGLATSMLWIVNSTEKVAWGRSMGHLRLFLHGGFSLGEVISPRMGIRTFG